MVEFNLPANSKVKEGKTFPAPAAASLSCSRTPGEHMQL